MECIKNGISKVNYATDLRLEFTAGIREVLKDENIYDPKQYTKNGIYKVKEYVMKKILVCGSEYKG